MQADTNLQNTEIQSYEIAGCPYDEALEKRIKGHLVAETDEYTLRWFAKKNLCEITFWESQFSALVEQGKRLKILNDTYLMNRLDNFGADVSPIDKVFKAVSTLKFEDAIVEVSAFNSLIIKLKFANDILLLINIPEENLIEDNPTAVFSLLENRKTIVDNYNSIENIVIGMETFLDQ